MKLNERFLAQMREATALLQSEGPQAATAAIQRALGGSASAFNSTPATPAAADAHTAGKAGAPAGDGESPAWFRKAGAGTWAGSIARQTLEDIEDVEANERFGASEPGRAGKGRFLAGTCSNAAGTRNYKLYVPSGYADIPLPLVVMLHGCTQNPDDFAAGTAMNVLAEEQNFLVLYPAQTKTANPSNCWNWFQPADQARDRGEPSLIADMTRKIAREYKIDTQRVYVAGLSAGGAMAAILGARYPDLYAAVGVHSGLPVGVAHDVGSAFAAMKSRRGKASARAAVAHPPEPLERAVPVIVFHGDGDRTVHVSNADKLVQQCTAAAAGEGIESSVQQGEASGGRRYTRHVFRGSEGRVLAEKWIVHGAGHAWAGGSSHGSYTDASGPNAAREMLRFFLGQASPPSPKR